jgi:CNT family concentrative nucleoside transporter
VAAGTIDGVRLAVNVAAMLIVFLALTHLADWLLAFVGQRVFHASWSLEALLGALFSPLAWLMGAPLRDVSHLGALLGQKTVLNEFVAYSNMSQKLANDPGWLSPRGQLIAAYALCGFANFGTVGIQIAGYSSLAPSRRADVARIAPRALLGGLLTTCLVACVAGALA